MRIQSICLTLLLAGLTFGSSGCLALVVGAGAAGTVAYVAGDIESEEPYNLDQVYAAAKKATEDLKLYTLRGEGGRDALSATVVARDAADKRVTIKIKATTVETTKLSIRVGTFGDQVKSRLIYNRIRDNLKAAAPSPATAQAPASPPADSPSTSPPADSPPASSAAESAATPAATDPPEPPVSPADVQEPPEPAAQGVGGSGAPQ